MDATNTALTERNDSLINHSRYHANLRYNHIGGDRQPIGNISTDTYSCQEEQAVIERFYQSVLKNFGHISH
jgi:hypothetical protein